MRRALSILLVLVFGMPALVPLLGAATSGDASIPACCRRHGQHHCLMSDSERSMLQATGVAAPEFRAPAPKCPYQRQVVRAAQQGQLAAPVSPVVYAVLASHPTGLAQPQSKWRLARERARQKRGPPIDLLS